MTQSISMSMGPPTIFCEYVKLIFWMGDEIMQTAEQQTLKMKMSSFQQYLWL